MSGKNPDLTTVTLSLTHEYKDKLKTISIQEHKTVSGIVREWIDAYEEDRERETR